MPPDALALIRRAKAEAKAAKAESPAGMAENKPSNQAAALATLPPPPLCLAAVPPPVALAGMPPDVCYAPSWVSEDDESTLLQHILGAAPERWTPGTGRRTQNWGGRPGEQQVAEQLPGWLRQLVDALMRSGAWPATEEPPNHVIINDYHDPRTGLTPHTDGPLYADCVAVLSLLADVVLELHRPIDAAVACTPATRLGRMLLRRRSLNVLRGDACAPSRQTEHPVARATLRRAPRGASRACVGADRCFHGIPAAERDVVDSSVVNLREAAGAEGEEVPRVRRVSIVFVAKRAERPAPEVAVT